MTASNVYERSARLEKARAIVPIVQQLARGLDESPLSTVRRLSTADRAAVCRIAAVNIASDETWALVLESLELAETLAGQVA